VFESGSWPSPASTSAASPSAWGAPRWSSSSDLRGSVAVFTALLAMATGLSKKQPSRPPAAPMARHHPAPGRLGPRSSIPHSTAISTDLIQAGAGHSCRARDGKPLATAELMVDRRAGAQG